MFTKKVTSVDEDLNNQVNRVTHSVDPWKPPSPATPGITQWSYEQSGSSGREGVGHGLSNMHFYSPGPFWLENS